jgi:hypothetical protein
VPTSSSSIDGEDWMHLLSLPPLFVGFYQMALAYTNERMTRRGYS